MTGIWGWVLHTHAYAPLPASAVVAGPGTSSPLLFSFCRNLKIGYFSQHHVDQLDLNISAVELLARKFPGEFWRSQEMWDMEVSFAMHRAPLICSVALGRGSVTSVLKGHRLLWVESPPPAPVQHTSREKPCWLCRGGRRAGAPPWPGFGGR